MTLLGSILPGLRELRAPLAAGYGWLIFGWLVFHESLSKSRASPGLVHDIARALENRPVAILAVLTAVCSYVIGCVSLAVFRPVQSLLVRAFLTILDTHPLFFRAKRRDDAGATRSSIW